MNTRRNWTYGAIVVWAIAAFVISAIVSALVMLPDPPESASSYINNFDYWFERYQAFIAGIIGLTGGVLAFFGIRQQISANRIESQKDRFVMNRQSNNETINDCRKSAENMSFLLAVSEDFLSKCAASPKSPFLLSEKARERWESISTDRYGIAFRAESILSLDREMARIYLSYVSDFDEFADCILHCGSDLNVCHARVSAMKWRLTVMNYYLNAAATYLDMGFDGKYYSKAWMSIFCNDDEKVSILREALRASPER